jgi:superfamily I DNA/RNA helicase
MAIICRHYAEMERCAAVLRYRKLPHEVRTGSGTFNPLADTVKILTMHASKGLEFPVVALSGVGRMPEEGHEEADEARLFYVAATRATQRLLIPVSGHGTFASRLPAAQT